MKSRIIPFLLYLLPMLWLSSCSTFEAPDFKRIDNVRVSKFGLTESTLTLDLHYFNPNKARLKLKEAKGDAWLDGNLLGHFAIDTLIHIPARDSFYLPVKLQVDMSKILKNSFIAFLGKEVIVKIEGKAKLGKGLLYIHYPVRYEGKQNLAELLK